MPTFRNKPIEIEAYQLTKELVDMAVLDKHIPIGLRVDASDYHPGRREVHRAVLSCVTIHGQRTKVEIGDWIITEPDGIHHYPCKPDIFAQRYVPV